MRRTGLLVGALSLAAVLAFVVHEAERPSPGPLHPSHSADAELETCAACHSEAGEGFAATCGACHAEIAGQVAGGSGLHGALPPELARDCARCHLDHQGAALPLVGDLAFARAGVGDRARFDHARDARLEFPLAGRHAELACAACHPAADAPALEPGQRRFLGASADCAACHDDPHGGAFGTLCESCHGQERPFTDAAGLRHDRFPLRGPHAQVECAACHEAGGRHAVAASAAAPPAEVRACAACHASPHRGGEAVLLRDDADCERCHAGGTFAGTRFGPEEHAAAGVVLDGAHVGADCAGCHTPARLGTDLALCSACHEDAHTARGRSLAAFRSTPACQDCHGTGAFSPPTVGADDHVRFGTELSAAHERLPCTACHARTEPSAADAGDCAACHASPHRAQFVGSAACADCHLAEHRAFGDPALALALDRHPGLPLVAPHDVECASCHPPEGLFSERFPGRAADACADCHLDPHAGRFRAFADAACRTCHAEDRFSPPEFPPALHARSAFPLEGAHQAVPCAVCHVQDGAARRFAGTTTACDGCHTDPHAGRFDRPGLPRIAGAREGCLRCHGTRTFQDVPAAAFDHALWTGRPLTGAHARASCARCHGRDRSGALGSAPPDCAGCHADPHGGQLARAGRTDCARCHVEAGTFEELDFDHALDTRFPLDRNHARLPCAACHRPVPAASGGTVTRYRPLGTTCRECHDSRRLDAAEESR